MSKKKREIPDELLEQLLASVEDPKDLLGSEGHSPAGGEEPGGRAR